VVDAEEAERDVAGGLKRFFAGRVQSKDMLRSTIVIALVWSTLTARAAQRVTVEQLEQLLAQQQTAHVSDEEEAGQLGSLELSERLNGATLERLKVEFTPGTKTAKQLDVLADLSAFLHPPEGELPQLAPPSATEQREMLNAATRFATVTLSHLPDFLATRTTWNFEDVPVLTADMSTQSGMHFVSESASEVAYRGGLEIAGRSTQAEGGSRVALAPNLSSAGEFGPVLATIVTDSEHGKIAWSHWERTSEGVTGVYDYKVLEDAAHYVLEFCCGLDPESKSYKSYHGRPAYHGTMTVDPRTGAILRVTVEADIEAFDPVQHFGLLVDYGPVEISGDSLMCPLHSAAILRAVEVARKRNWDVIHVNDVKFSNYRRFGSTARIVPNAAR
jgi:hypothetical protein